MAKEATVIKNPGMEGKVERGVDFNLKKEDLMLLILEGKKETMEEEIGKLQTTSTSLQKQLTEAEKKLHAKIKKHAGKTLNTEADKLAKAFFAKDKEADLEEKGASPFKISIRTSNSEGAGYTHFAANPIGNGKGSAYIKTQDERRIGLTIPSRMSITMNFSIHGKIFAKKDKLFGKETPGPCQEYSKEITLVDERLDLDFVKETSEYKVLHGVAKDLAANEQLLSDILAEYDLFNRNQPRAKAKMIKQVLSRDEAGQALLGNIFEAAKGVKLLAVESNG